MCIWLSRICSPSWHWESPSHQKGMLKSTEVCSSHQSSPVCGLFFFYIGLNHMYAPHAGLADLFIPVGSPCLYLWGLQGQVGGPSLFPSCLYYDSLPSLLKGTAIMTGLYLIVSVALNTLFWTEWLLYTSVCINYSQISHRHLLDYKNCCYS